MPGLMEKCEKSIINSINFRNAFEWHVFGYRNNAVNLKQAAADFFVE